MGLEPEFCHGCDEPIRIGQKVVRCTDGTPYHDLCFEIIAAALEMEIKAALEEEKNGVAG